LRNLLIVLLMAFLLVPLLAVTQALPDNVAIKLGTPVTTPMPKQVLQPSQLAGGRMRLLQRNTGMSAEEISRLYTVSGARNFGQFTCAMLVSQQLKLDREAVLHGLYANNLGQVIQRMGVDSAAARNNIVAAVHEIVEAEKVAR